MFQKSETSPNLGVEKKHSINEDKKSRKMSKSKTFLSIDLFHKKSVTQPGSEMETLPNSSDKTSETQNINTLDKAHMPTFLHNKLSTLSSRSTKLPLLQKIDLAYTELWRNAKQQTIPRSIKFHKLFLPSTSSIIFGTLAIIFFSLGTAIHFINNQITEITISYDMDDSELLFNVQETIQPPIHIYYEITGFYGNSRLYVRDAPSSIFSESSCIFIKNYRQAFDVRTNNGGLSLPELRNNVLNGMTIFPDDKPVYPCGLASVSIFNDKAEILGKNDEKVPISTTILDNDFDLVEFMDPLDKIDKQQAWTVQHNLDYRIWLHPASTSDFRKTYGTINVPLEAGNYKLKLTTNLWPSKSWGCTKAFTLTQVKAFGGKNLLLPILLFATGGLYAFFTVVMLAIYFSRLIILSKTFKIVDLPELKFDLSFEKLN